MTQIALMLYVLACILVANLGSKRVMGFWVTAILTVILTPFIVFPILLLTQPRKEPVTTEPTSESTPAAAA